ncbi:MAG TPA: acetylornithine deacetylase [Thermopetrobacter sp.]|nr:acetylornithine deacetylase [Thermopetrobacter sp.]
MAKPFSTLELLERLVAFDTTSRNSNLALIDFVAGWLADFGVSCRRIPFGPDKANLLAVIGPTRPGGVVLSGHTDVVPVDDQDWSSDPFRLRVDEETGRAFGRGTADMKGFLACALALVPRLVEMPLSRPVILAFSCDEEVGCTGVRPMIEWMRANLPPVAGVFVGEPTGMEVVTAHKGIISLTTTVTGREAHSSCPQLGVNAAMYAGEIIGEIARIAAEERDRADPASGFEPPWTTVGIGVVHGGTARNIIPRHCVIEWEARLMPGTDEGDIPARLARFVEREILPRMRAEDPRSGVETVVDNAVPGLPPDDDSLPARLAMRFVGANRCHRVSFGTEAGLFAAAGMPAVICGPGHIAQAHRPDEYVELSQLAACDAFLRRLADWCRDEVP